MEKTFTPEICQGEAAEYEGTYTLRMPTYDERMAMYEEAGVGDDTAEKKGNLAFARQLAKRLPSHLVAVAIKRKADGHAFASLDDLQYDSDMANVISEMAGKLVGKVRAGNG